MSATPAGRTFEPGDMLGERYRVDRILARGGMGVLVAATDLSLDRPVALKFPSVDTLADDKARARFLREARLAARLRSEHVVKILDVGSIPERGPFIAMELLEGRDLKQHLAEVGVLPVETATAFVLQACEAVAEAHAHGIVHRDLKARNLFLARHVHGAPLIKVLDFGISKVALARQHEWARNPDEVTLTGTGEIMGSTAYMPPEQLVSARDVDATADIWAIGVVLFELLTGGLPFRGATPKEVAVAILGGKAPLDELTAFAPPELVRVVARCLDKAPSKRFRSVAELAAALEPFAGTAALGAAVRVAGVAAIPPPAAPARAEVPGATPPAEDRRDGTDSVATTVPAQPARPRPRWPAVVVLGVIAGAALFAVRAREGAAPTTGDTASSSAPDPTATWSAEPAPTASAEQTPPPPSPPAAPAPPAPEATTPIAAASRASASAPASARGTAAAARPRPAAARPAPAGPPAPRVFIPDEPR
jgi:serine/threonine-protein kinase